jgi:hypothetical protein
MPPFIAAVLFTTRSRRAGQVAGQQKAPPSRPIAKVGLLFEAGAIRDAGLFQPQPGFYPFSHARLLLTIATDFGRLSKVLAPKVDTAGIPSTF